jgi:hypothetical protein
MYEILHWIVAHQPSALVAASSSESFLKGSFI